MLEDEFSAWCIKFLVLEALVAVAAVVVLGQVQLGYWGSGAHGQHHLRVLDGRDDATVVVAAGVQQSGASGLDRVTRTVVVAALVATIVAAANQTAIAAEAADTAQAVETANVSNVSVSTAMSIAAVSTMTVARVDQDGAQLLAAAITGTGNDLNGTLVVATDSSGAGCGSGTTLRTLSVVGDAAVSTIVGAAIVAAADSQVGAEEYRESLYEGESC